MFYRKWLWAGLLSAVGIGGGMALHPLSGEARPGNREEKSASKSVQLPIGQVVLFTSGVGYFQREGTVEGDARVDLSFPASDINDLIKSMVLRDLNGGHISTVSYDSNSPVERTLKSFAVNLTGNPAFGEILSQARGEKVEVSLLQQAGGQPASLTGTIIGMEKKAHPGPKDVKTEVESVSLWCSDGMRSLALQDIARVRFLNPVIESEFRKALETLAQSHDSQKKAVSIQFSGEGKREVRVGYVVENPIWKTSYRLVLDKKEKPFIQGWAVVENATDEDWKDVRMALVSGRPISFQMDLYSPLFVPRPTVEPELFASLRPPTYNSSLGRNELFFAKNQMEKSPEQRKGESNKQLYEERDGKDATKERFRSESWADNAARENGVKESTWSMPRLNLGSSVSTAATAARLGDFFQYAIDRPVSLSRQKSALLPIVTKEVDASRLSIYNEATQAKFPLLGLRLKNTTGLHLMQGPMTVFDGSNYAGDSRILDVQPNEERLLSYAIDLGTEVNPVASQDNGRMVSVKAVKGIITTTTRIRETKTYTIANRNDAERLVLIEHPVRNEFSLIGTEKPLETARDFYRFQVKVGPNKTEKQVVTEERLLGQSIEFRNFNDDQIKLLLKETVLSPQMKAGLKQAQELRWAEAKTGSEVAELEKQLKIIVEDQTRLRANLKEMPSTAAAYARYLKKFDDQETTIEKLQADIKRLQGVQFNQKKDYEEFLVNFSAE